MFWGASMVTLRPRSVLNFSTIGVRARPRSLSIQTKSSPLVHANSFGVTIQRANNINNKRFIEGRGKNVQGLELPDSVGVKKSSSQRNVSEGWRIGRWTEAASSLRNSSLQNCVSESSSFCLFILPPHQDRWQKLEFR